MAYPAKLLAPDENIQFEMKPHWRAILAPALVLIITVFAFSFLITWVSTWFEWLQWLKWVVIGGAILVLALWAIRPFLHWLTTEYVFTDRRVIVRSGIITKQGRDVPLSKINNVSFSVPALGRVLNYGQLDIQSAGENDGLVIRDVPNVEVIQRDGYRLTEEDDARRRGRDGGAAPATDGT